MIIRGKKLGKLEIISRHPLELNMLRDRRVPAKSCSIPAAPCVSLAPRQEKPHLCIFFFCFRVIFPPRDGHKAAPECRCSWPGAPVLPGAAHTSWAQAQPGHSPWSSCRVHQTPLSPGFDVCYQCWKSQETFFLFVSLQISFVMAKRNKL